MKPIRLSHHAMGYIARRGFTVVEVVDAIRTCSWQSAEMGRMECRNE